MSALGNEIRKVAREILRSDTRAVLNHLASKVDDLAPEPQDEPIPYQTDEGVVVAVDLDGTVHRALGKPSDAQVRAAFEEYQNSLQRRSAFESMRSALRAAGGVR